MRSVLVSLCGPFGASDFHRRTCPAFLRRPPTVASRVHSPSSLSVPFRVRPTCGPPRSASGPEALRPLFRRSSKRLPWGYREPSSRHQQSESTRCAAIPSSALRSVPGVPPTLDGLLLRLPRGLVSSRNHVQGSPFRGLATPRSRSRVSPVRALSPLVRRDLRLPAPTAPALDLRALLPATSETVCRGR